MEKRNREEEHLHNNKKHKIFDIGEIVSAVISSQPDQWPGWMGVNRSTRWWTLDIAKKYNLSEQSLSIDQILNIMARSKPLCEILHKKLIEYVEAMDDPIIIPISVSGINDMITTDMSAFFKIEGILYVIQEDDLIDNLSFLAKNSERMMRYNWIDGLQFNVIPSDDDRFQKVAKILRILLKKFWKKDRTLLLEHAANPLVQFALKNIIFVENVTNAITKMIAKQDAFGKLVAEYFWRLIDLWIILDVSVDAIVKCLIECVDFLPNELFTTNVMQKISYFTCHFRNIAGCAADDVIEHSLRDSNERIFVLIWHLKPTFSYSNDPLGIAMRKRFPSSKVDEFLFLYRKLAERNIECALDVALTLVDNSFTKSTLLLPLDKTHKIDIYSTKEILSYLVRIGYHMEIHIWQNAIHRTSFLDNGTFMTNFFDLVKISLSFRKDLVKFIAREICQNNLPIFVEFFREFSPVDDDVWKLEFVKGYVARTQFEKVFQLFVETFAKAKDTARHLLITMLEKEFHDNSKPYTCPIRFVVDRCFKVYPKFGGSPDLDCFFSFFVEKYPSFLDRSDVLISTQLVDCNLDMIWNNELEFFSTCIDSFSENEKLTMTPAAKIKYLNVK